MRKVQQLDDFPGELAVCIHWFVPLPSNSDK